MYITLEEDHSVLLFVWLFIFNNLTKETGFIVGAMMAWILATNAVVDYFHCSTNRSSENSHIFIYDISKYCQNLLLTVYNRWQRCSCIYHYLGHDTRLCLQELPADEYNEREILPGWMLDLYGEGVRWLCCAVICLMRVSAGCSSLSACYLFHCGRVAAGYRGHLSKCMCMRAYDFKCTPSYSVCSN